MSTRYNPSIVLDGLVMALDTANPKCYDSGENLVAYSEQLDNAYWITSAVTLTPNAAIAPDGNLAAEKLSEDTTNARHYIQKSINITANTAYTASVYAKKAENNYATIIYGQSGSPYTRGGSIVNLTDGTITTYTNGTPINVIRPAAVDVGNGWWRISVSVLFDTTSTTGYIEIGTCINPSFATYAGVNTVNGIYLWGAQLEKGTVMSPYTATGASTISRSYSLLDLSGNGNNMTLFGGPTLSSTDQGGLKFDGATMHGNCATAVVSANSYTKMAFFRTTDLTYNNNILSSDTGGTVFWLAGSNKIKAGTQVNVSLVAGATSLNTNTWYHGAVTFDRSYGYVLYLNGVQDGASSNTTPHAGDGTIQMSLYGGGNRFIGDISYPMIYNRALSAAEISQNFNALRGRVGI
jgi:hypothetical protein